MARYPILDGDWAGFQRMVVSADCSEVIVTEMYEDGGMLDDEDEMYAYGGMLDDEDEMYEDGGMLDDEDEEYQE